MSRFLPLRTRWDRLLFAHWPVAAAPLQAMLPEGLTLDTFQGQAWVGVVPFFMEDTGLRLFPSVPGVSSFAELNVRTYVRVGERRGVWFFSLDAASAFAVKAARAIYHLPYFHAEMESSRLGDRIDYESRRLEGPPATFAGEYGPSGPVFTSAPGSLEEFLTERYALFSVKPGGALLTADVVHVRWPLQPATARLTVDGLVDWLGLRLEGPPASLLYSESISVHASAPRPITP